MEERVRGLRVVPSSRVVSRLRAGTSSRTCSRDPVGVLGNAGPRGGPGVVSEVTEDTREEGFYVCFGTRAPMTGARGLGVSWVGPFLRSRPTDRRRGFPDRPPFLARGCVLRGPRPVFREYRLEIRDKMGPTLPQFLELLGRPCLRDGHGGDGWEVGQM